MAETVDTVVQFALQAEACSYAGVVLTLRGSREIGAVTDPLVTEIYQLQFETGDGPLLVVLSEGTAVHIPDVESETRWPTWAARLTQYGVKSVLHVPMWAGAQLIGVLSLYNTEANAFTVDDEAIAHILARHASIAVASARNDETMAAAVDARKLVGQAMGILMERFDLDDTRAFEILKRYSQQNNRKLRDVAQELIDTRSCEAPTMSDEQLTVEVVDRGPDLLISVAGEMDFGTNADFLRVVQPLAQSGRSLVLDLAELAFCDSSGLGALVRVHKMTEESGGTLCLARLRPQIRSTITLTMLHRLFHLSDDLPDAGGDSNHREVPTQDV